MEKNPHLEKSPLALNSQAHQDPHLLQAEPASKHAARKTVPYEVASVEIKYPLRPPCSIACSITNMRTGARCFGLPIYKRYRPCSSSLASIRLTISISQSSILPLRSIFIFSYKSSKNIVPEADTPADIIEVPVVNLSSAVDPEPVVPKRLVAIIKAYAHQFDHYIRCKPQPCTSHDRSIKLSLHLSTRTPLYRMPAHRVSRHPSTCHSVSR